MLQPCRAKDVFEDGFLLQKCSGSGQNQSAPKTVPELATHWHSRGPQSKLHASSAVLGWGLATAGSIGMAPSHLQITPSHLQIFNLQYWDGAFSPAVFFSGRFFTCSFGMAPSRAAKFTAKKIINGIMAVLPQRLHLSR